MNDVRSGPGQDADALADAVRWLPRDLPPAGLAESICASLAHFPRPRRSLYGQVLYWMERPAVTLAYRFATLALLAGIFAGVWSLVAVRRSPGPGIGETGGDPAATARGTRLPQALPPAPGPELAARTGGDAPPAPKVTVTFVFRAPEAGSVAVVGSFNDWDPGRGSMVRGADGSWTVRVELAPGQYEYQFVVDGSRFVPDPDAIEQRDDGMGGSNAVLRL